MDQRIYFGGHAYCIGIHGMADMPGHYEGILMDYIMTFLLIAIDMLLALGLALVINQLKSITGTCREYEQSIDGLRNRANLSDKNMELLYKRTDTTEHELLQVCNDITRNRKAINQIIKAMNTLAWRTYKHMKPEGDKAHGNDKKA
jgi:uncharacterized protein YoxC